MVATKSMRSAPMSPVAKVLGSFKRVFVGVGLMSGLVNLLMLTGSLFMMQVYDRVLSSHSIPNLISLATECTPPVVCNLTKRCNAFD